MTKRFLLYLIPLVVYIFLPGISQQIFMEYDDYYFYIIVTLLLIVNLLFAFNYLKLRNKIYNFIAAIIVTSVGILSVIVMVKFYSGWNGITISVFSNAISSILAWEIIYLIDRKKTVANSSL